MVPCLTGVSKDGAHLYYEKNKEAEGTIVPQQKTKGSEEETDLQPLGNHHLTNAKGINVQLQYFM